MSRYNHFAEKKYQSVCFGSLEVGEKFRMDKFKDGRRRKDILMIKTSESTYCEARSKKEYNVFHSAFDVSVAD